MCIESTAGMPSLHLGCDNTGVIGTLRRGYSHLPDAKHILNTLSEAMPPHFDFVVVFYVPFQ